jgi:hypothetical protein
MITKQQLVYGWINISGVTKAKATNKCQCYGCANKVQKGDNVAKLSSGVLCPQCSDMAFDTVEMRQRRYIQKIKDMKKEFNKK